jgi:hypothetical protein
MNVIPTPAFLPLLHRPRQLAAVLAGGQTAYMVEGTICGCGCGRAFRPTDIEIFDDSGWRIVCPNSGRTIMGVQQS